jgi:hypothetical protein
MCGRGSSSHPNLAKKPRAPPDTVDLAPTSNQVCTMLDHLAMVSWGQESASLSASSAETGLSVAMLGATTSSSPVPSPHTGAAPAGRTPGGEPG